MIRKNKWVKLLQLSALFAAVLSSCSKEYDLSEEKMDMNVTVGGEKLSFPLGSTDSIKLGDYVDLDKIDLIHQDENGNLYLEFLQSVKEEVSIDDFIRNLDISGMETSFKAGVDLAPYLPSVPPVALRASVDGEPLPAAGGELIQIDEKLNEVVRLSYSIEDARTYGLADIDSILFDDAGIRLSSTLQLTGFEKFEHPLTVALKLRCPGNYQLLLENKPVPAGEILLEGSSDKNGQIRFPLLSIRKMSFDVTPGQKLEFEDVFTIDNLQLTLHASDLLRLVDPTAPLPSSIMLNLNTKIQIGSAKDNTLKPSKFYGIFDKKLDPVKEKVRLEDIPDFMKNEDVVLDFYSPYAKVNLKTNVGVPILVDVDMSARNSAGSLLADPLHLGLKAPVSQDYHKIEAVNYWVSKTAPENLAPEYEWVKGDIGSLVKTIPDEVEVAVRPRTDMSVPNHFIDFDAKYAIQGDFSFTVPFAFGKDLNMALRDTIREVPEALTKVLKAADIILAGDVESTFPVDLVLNVLFLDGKGNQVPVETEPALIKACSDPSAPQKTDLNLSMKKLEDKDGVVIQDLVVEFRMRSGEVEGLNLNVDSYLKAVLNASAPGGITLDLSELNKNTNN